MGKRLLVWLSDCNRANLGLRIFRALLAANRGDLLWDPVSF